MGVDERAQVVREVVELGEELFELALRGYDSPESEETRVEDDTASPVADLRAAADEFFRVLRGLLDVRE